MDIAKMSLTELQALAYKFLVEADRINKNLSVVQQEIAKREAAAKESTAKEGVAKEENKTEETATPQ